MDMIVAKSVFGTSACPVAIQNPRKIMISMSGYISQVEVHLQISSYMKKMRRPHIHLGIPPVPAFFWNEKKEYVFVDSILKFPFR